MKSGAKIGSVINLRALCFYLSIISTLGCSALKGEIIEGRVIEIHDGDSITLLTRRNQQIKVRMVNIDSPELGQEHAAASKAALAAKVFGEKVTVKSQGRDHFGRVLGAVLLRGENVNLWMVKQGYSWCYKAYSNDIDFYNAEIRARKEKAGLWKSPIHPIPPWEFRKID